jgi:hypothetical protein
MPDNEADLDRPIWGARAIAIEAGLFDEHGEPDVVRAFYLLEKGYIPANKRGRAYVSTPRRVRSVGSGEQQLSTEDQPPTLEKAI